MSDEILIYDELGPGYWGLIDAKFVIDQLSTVADDAPITVRINSPGGDIGQGIAIYNALTRRPGPVYVEIDALAASAASYVAMAGNRIRIAENAMLMIHNPWTVAVGDVDVMLKAAEVLRKYGDIVTNTYADRSKQSQEIVERWMSEETWMTAKEAVERGFADDVVSPTQVEAMIRPAQFPRQPPQLTERRRRYSEVDYMERRLQLAKRRWVA